MKYLVISLFSVSVLAACSSAPATDASGMDSIATDTAMVDSMGVDTAFVAMPDSAVDSLK